MTQQVFIDLLQNVVWLIILLSAPILTISMMVGLAISIFQAVTQIQEATITFVPKILAAFLVLVLAGPWMVSMMVDYSQALFDDLTRIAQLPK